MNEIKANPEGRLLQLHRDISNAVLLLLDMASEAGGLLLNNPASLFPREGMQWFVNEHAEGLRGMAKLYITIHENYEQLRNKPELLLSDKFTLLASLGLDDKERVKDMQSTL